MTESSSETTAEEASDELGMPQVFCTRETARAVLVTLEAMTSTLEEARDELAWRYVCEAGRMGIPGTYPELAKSHGGSPLVEKIDTILAQYRNLTGDHT